ncbi:hypothetical protein [Cyclobacterium amurskyense]|uniref:Uncharacterized protein n=1 Tax=Cyclobacterium amurskyense TaxID=320787 RepID=A0A0H4PH36_9BACT|nr:hypothetical protein [Cyclobacterium amurskyense]AKP52168.1 hypothetical protein CA2015_2758 [Cyclobacterium amurskyense]|tara:strand:+ start:4183 stop:4557 length:375 start_codon:yes stop_codon:yes gene_type:complete
MKRQIIIGLGVIILFILIMINPLAKPQRTSQQMLEVNNDNYLFQSSVYDTRGSISDTVNISIADLPKSIQHVIQTDSLINNLEIRTVKRISKNNNDFYDVCFKDTDYFNIMVLYDKNGLIVSQL